MGNSNKKDSSEKSRLNWKNAVFVTAGGTIGFFSAPIILSSIGLSAIGPMAGGYFAAL
jgi:hypothetical protein